MSIYIPFNNKPVSVAVKTGAYTIPAGYYARITVSLKAWASGYISLTGSATLDNGTTALNHTTQDSQSLSQTFFVPSGTDLDCNTQVASDSDSGASTTAQLIASGNSYANFSIDTVKAADVFVGAVCYCKNGSSDASNYYSATVVGAADAMYTVELFAEPS